MLWVVLISGFVTGLAGSVHCIGMCGPLAMGVPGRRGRWQSISLYLLGKTCTYALLGGLFGYVGSQLYLAGVQQAISIVAGILLLVIVGAMLFKKSWMHQRRLSGWIAQKLGPLFIKVMEAPPALASIGFGLLNGLLPCGLVYMGLIGAMAQPSWQYGFLFMTAFGIGTMPLMLGFLLLAKQFSFQFRHTLQKIMPFCIFFMAVLLIIRGLGLSIPYLSPDLSGLAEKSVERIGCH